MHDRLRRPVIELNIALVVLSFVIGIVREHSAVALPHTYVVTSTLPRVVLTSLAVLFALGIVVRACRAIQAGGRRASGGPSQKTVEEQRAKRTTSAHGPAAPPAPPQRAG